MEKETKHILEKIRQKRVEKKMSIMSLANKVGISHSHLYYIERKDVIPSIDLLIKIVKALDCSLIDILLESSQYYSEQNQLTPPPNS